MSNVVRGAARGTLWSVASQLSLTLSGYLTAVILARGLGPADFGVYGLVYSFLLAVELVAVLGIPGAVARLLADGREDARSVAASGLCLIALICVSTWGLLHVLAPWIAGLFNTPTATDLFRVAIIDIPFFGLYFLISHVLNGRRDFFVQSIGTLLYASTKVVGVYMLSLTGLSVAGALIVNIIGSVVGLAAVAWGARGHYLGVTLSVSPQILRLALPIALGSLATMVLTNLDLWLLGALAQAVGADTGGYYVAAKNLARVPNVMAFVLNSILVPSIAFARASGDSESVRRLIHGSLRFVLVILVPGCALMAVEARPLMALLFSEQYTDGARYLSWLAFSNGLLQTLLTICGSILIALRYPRSAAMVSLATVGLAVAISYPMTLFHGAIGAAVASVVAATIATAGAGIVTYRLAGTLLQLKVLFKALALTAILTGVAVAIPSAGLWFLAELALLGGLLVVTATALGLVSREDLALIRK